MNTLPFLILLSLFSLPSFAGFKLATYNIRNFDYDSRSNVFTNKPHLVKTLTELDADLIGVQEINKIQVFDNMIQDNFRGKFKTVFTECGGAHEQRLGFIYNKDKFRLTQFTQDLRTVNVNQSVDTRNFDCRNGSRPLAVAQFRELATGREILAISVHLKSGGRPKSIQKRFKQLKVIKNLIEEKRRDGFEHFIVLGDFNSTQYNSKGNGHSRFVGMVSDMRLNDTASNLSCTAYWWGGINDSTQYPSSLDHMLVSQSLSASTNSKAEVYGHCAKLTCGVTSEAEMGISFDQVSDHCPIAVELK